MDQIKLFTPPTTLHPHPSEATTPSPRPPTPVHPLLLSIITSRPAGQFLRPHQPICSSNQVHPVCPMRSYVFVSWLWTKATHVQLNVLRSVSGSAGYFARTFTDQTITVWWFTGSSWTVDNSLCPPFLTPSIPRPGAIALISDLGKHHSHT